MSEIVNASVAAASAAVSSLNFCTGADCASCIQDDCDREATLKASQSHNFEWEAELDLLLAPVQEVA